MPLDSTLLFFTSARSGALGTHSIFWSRRTAGVWSAPAIAAELNNAQSNGMPTIMPEGQTMYFTGCDYGFGDCDLYRVVSLLGLATSLILVSLGYQRFVFRKPVAEAK